MTNIKQLVIALSLCIAPLSVSASSPNQLTTDTSCVDGYKIATTTRGVSFTSFQLMGKNGPVICGKRKELDAAKSLAYMNAIIELNKKIDNQRMTNLSNSDYKIANKNYQPFGMR